MRSNFAIWAAALVTVGSLTTAAFADLETAKKYVAEAKEKLESKDFDDAKTKLELAEAELEGVDAAAKAPVVASIADAQKQIGAARIAQNGARYKRRLSMAVTDVEGAIGNLATWNGAAAQLKEMLDNPDVQEALPDDVAAAKRKFSTFEKLHSKKAATANAARAEQVITDLEKVWAESKPKLATDDKNSAMRDVESELESARRSIERTGMDAEQAKPYLARLDKVGEAYAAIALADQAKEMATRIKESWASYAEEYAGWEKETKAPTLAEIVGPPGQRSDNAMSLNAPKSVGLISRTEWTLGNLKTNEDYQKVASAAAVKAVVDPMKADLEAAHKRVDGFAAAVIAEAEKAKLNDDQLAGMRNFLDRLDHNMEGSPNREALVARTKALIERNEKGNADAEVQTASMNKEKGEKAAAAYKVASEKAAADWPAMKAKWTTSEGFDPNAPAAFKGKYILITTDNLMGYRFGPGDFPFATTLDGSPIAGKYDPAVAKAIKEVEEQLGRSLGDNDDDGKWEIVAQVNGTTGKLTKRENVEGQVRDQQGNTATVTGERRETVDAPIITIVAAKCGPLAVSK